MATEFTVRPNARTKLSEPAPRRPRRAGNAVPSPRRRSASTPRAKAPRVPPCPGSGLPHPISGRCGRSSRRAQHPESHGELAPDVVGDARIATTCRFTGSSTWFLGEPLRVLLRAWGVAEVGGGGAGTDQQQVHIARVTASASARPAGPRRHRPSRPKQPHHSSNCCRDRTEQGQYSPVGRYGSTTSPPHRPIAHASCKTIYGSASGDRLPIVDPRRGGVRRGTARRRTIRSSG
jgi:hypothetical protein